MVCEAATVAFARTFFVAVFTMAVLLGGAIESALADRAEAGLGRSRPCDVDPAALENSADADSDDADDDARDRDWIACGPLSPGVRRSCFVHLLDATADIFVPRRPRATAFIRGPPVRG